MGEDEGLKRLEDLAQVDIDTVYAYDRAIDQVDDEVMRARLERFRQAHFDHIAALAEVIRAMGGTPPDLSKDLRGYAVEALAALRATPGTKGALKALRTVEQIAHRHYSGTVSDALPQDARDLLRRHFSDEKVHLDYIEQNLKVM